MAPKNARAPPPSHRARNSMGLGTRVASPGGANRIVPPMTLETMIAAASSGPRRRSSVVAGLGIGPALYKCCRYLRLRRVVARSREQLALNWIFRQLGPRFRAPLQENLDLRVN